MEKIDSIDGLEDKAKQIRRDIIRMLAKAGSGHPGGSLSAADIVTALYFNVMNYRADNPKWDDRDRFVLSKGHACPVQYAAMARAGFFPVDELMTLRQIHSRLQGHVSKKDLPGVEASTGSLGQGLSIAVGIALAGKLDMKDYKVYCMLGDGELQEGQIWEAVMTAAQFKLSNLVAIVDYNKVQLSGFLDDIKCVECMSARWKAFGWNAIEINGHNMKQILGAFEKDFGNQKPTVIIADTIKGKGVSFMENKAEWHGMAPNAEEAEKALKELA
ncbi:transketolase [Candidatus Woesearchaeota archaeon]|nr:transketolase [Candidatus Woesearchaeota archaeon]